MEIQQWAKRILSADTMQEKLLDPGILTDHDPGPSIRFSEPSRPQELKFCRKGGKDKLPPFSSHGDSQARAICLHRFAGHELLAVEMMAFALLAFPGAPAFFRKGLAYTLQEEQEHVRLYCQRLQEMGTEFGHYPLYKHFWTHCSTMTDPIHYVSLMSLTLEMANLDFAPTYGLSFEKRGDLQSAALMSRILHDEIKHVSFGWQWLLKFKAPELSAWQTWTNSLPQKVEPKRAIGLGFNSAARLKAGLPEHWLDQLQATQHQCHPCKEDQGLAKTG